MKPGPRPSGAGTRREGDYRFEEAGAAAGFAAERRLLRRWRRVDLFAAGFAPAVLAVICPDAALADGAGFDVAEDCGAAGPAAKAAADRMPETARAASFFMIQ